VQLDPLDPWGTNADLVAFARVDGLRRGDVFRHVYPGHAFEHFAKERCLLPAEAFPWYRDRAAETPWWRLTERLKRLPAGLIAEVLAEVRERGPLALDALSDRGKVKPIDWNGWRGTGKASSMAIEVLWTRCEIVVCGRMGRGKVYDIPTRALPRHAQAPAGDFERWAVLERVEAAGLLTRLSGPQWSMLSETRGSPLIDQLVHEGELLEVLVEGMTRPYLARAGFRDRAFGAGDDRLRILGPLDPLLWDRGLVRHVFGFDYVWEVYKPASQRRWGWYVCPLLHRGRFVGRIEGSVEGEVLRVRHVWPEPGAGLEDDALRQALERHAEACSAVRIVGLRRRVARH
jgi:uncharacterized protein YcaQ